MQCAVCEHFLTVCTVRCQCVNTSSLTKPFSFTHTAAAATAATGIHGLHATLWKGNARRPKAWNHKNQEKERFLHAALFTTE